MRRPPVDLHIREYRPEDRASYARWHRDLAVAVAQTMRRHYPVRFPAERMRRDAGESLRLLRRARGFLLVAERDRRPVGFLMGELVAFPHPHERLTRKPNLAGMVDQLFVEPGARHRGVGTALLREAERRFLALGCDNLQLGVAAGNTVARRLYRSLGFQDYGLRLRKDVAPPPRDWNGVRERRARALRRSPTVRASARAKAHAP